MPRCKKCSAVLRCKGACMCNTCGYDPTKDQTIVEDKKEEEKLKMPSMLQQAKNLTKAVARHAMNGAQNVPQHIKDSRMDLCSTCEFLSGNRCSKCGCFVDKKTDWASEHCPIGKWSQYKATKGKCGGCGRK